jgi:hypothetical protein
MKVVITEKSLSSEEFSGHCEGCGDGSGSTCCGNNMSRDGKSLKQRLDSVASEQILSKRKEL